MLWNMMVTLSGLERWAAAAYSDSPTFKFMNENEIRSNWDRARIQYPDHETWEFPSLAFGSLPTVQIAITDPAFSVEYFTYQVYGFISNHNRDVFALDDSLIRYREVDMSASSPSNMERRFWAFDVVAISNPYDAARVPGEMRPVRQPDGSLKDEWVIALRQNLPPKTLDLYVRDDFVAPTPIFRALGTPWIYVTEAFADRVTRAGAKDIAFVAIEPSGSQPRVRHV